MSKTPPNGFKKIYALRRDILLDGEGLAKFLKERHPEHYEELMKLSTFELQLLTDAALRSMSVSEDTESE